MKFTSCQQALQAIGSPEDKKSSAPSSKPEEKKNSCVLQISENLNADFCPCCPGQAAPDDSDSENDSDSSPSQSRRNIDPDSLGSGGGMAIPDAEPPARERERDREPKEPREKEPNFGEAGLKPHQEPMARKAWHSVNPFVLQAMKS